MDTFDEKILYKLLEGKYFESAIQYSKKHKLHEDITIKIYSAFFLVLSKENETLRVLRLLSQIKQEPWFKPHWKQSYDISSDQVCLIIDRCIVSIRRELSINPPKEEEEEDSEEKKEEPPRNSITCFSDRLLLNNLPRRTSFHSTQTILHHYTQVRVSEIKLVREDCAILRLVLSNGQYSRMAALLREDTGCNVHIFDFSDGYLKPYGKVFKVPVKPVHRLPTTEFDRIDPNYIQIMTEKDCHIIKISSMEQQSTPIPGQSTITCAITDQKPREPLCGTLDGRLKRYYVGGGMTDLGSVSSNKRLGVLQLLTVRFDEANTFYGVLTSDGSFSILNEKTEKLTHCSVPATITCEVMMNPVTNHEFLIRSDKTLHLFRLTGPTEKSPFYRLRKVSERMINSLVSVCYSSSGRYLFFSSFDENVRALSLPSFLDRGGLVVLPDGDCATDMRTYKGTDQVEHLVIGTEGGVILRVELTCPSHTNQGE